VNWNACEVPRVSYRKERAQLCERHEINFTVKSQLHALNSCR
jgi:hypothetical protein